MDALSATLAARHPAPDGAAPDWTIPQDWPAYTAADHGIWNLLFARQMALLPGRVVPAFLSGVQALGMGAHGIPRFDELNERLHAATRWRVVAVPGLVPDAVFFHHLANRRFVAGRFIRSLQQLDYLEEPDVFHDVFGHVPLLADPAYADYLQAYGAGGLRSLRFGAMHELARLYWYTVEFGLMQQADGLRLFGAGIVSSHGESRYALEDPRPLRLPFDLRRVMRTAYRIDTFQPNYFVIRSFADLLHATVDCDFAPIYAELESLPTIEPGELLPGESCLPASSAGSAGSTVA